MTEEIKQKIKGFLNQAQPTYSGMDELAKLVYSFASEQLTAAEARIKELEGLLERASWLVGNPGTNISSSIDIACENWQNDYKQLLNK